MITYDSAFIIENVVCGTAARRIIAMGDDRTDAIGENSSRN